MFLNYKSHPLNNKKSLKAFSLIELLVSLTLLSIVITIGLGLFLSTSASVKQSRSQRRAMENINFAMESMSRSITYGYDFSCFSPVITSNCEITTVGSPEIYFKGNYLGTANVDFKYERLINSTTGYGYIARTVGAGAPISLTSDQIDIKELRFYVYNTDAFGSNPQQPRVVLTIKATSHASNTPEDFFIQTTLSQRNLKLQ